MKVGILTHYNVNNQGAQLQLLSLHRYLTNLGHDIYVLSYEKNFDFREGAKERNSGSFRAFPYYIRHYLLEKGLGLTWFNTRKVLCHRKAREQFHFLPHNCGSLDAIIIGSDEVYSLDVGCNPMMYGHDLGGVKAIGYAPSFGRTTMERIEEVNCRELIESGLSSMYRLSARDVHTQNLIQTLTGRDAPLVCDPVLLYKGGYDSAHKPIGKPYLVVYAYDSHMTDPDEIKAIRAYAKKHALLTVSLGTYHGWCDKNIVCDAESWYGYFADAACVVTDTFHGSVVAMKNHCNVAVFIRESINAFKLRSLLAETGLENRRLEAITQENLEAVLSQPIDYTQVDGRIEAMTAASEAYLMEALESLHG